VELVADVASICADASPAAERAQAALERIHRSIPFEAAALSTYDPVDHRHFTIAALNYSTEVLDYLNDGFVSDDPAYQTMRYRNPTPLRWCDIPGYHDMFSAHEIFIPAGFREGSTTCFFTREGRYTGAFHLNSDSPLPISDQAVDVLGALQRVIAPVLDALSAAPTPDWGLLVVQADEAALLTADRRVVDVPGGRRSRLLSDGAPLMLELAGSRTPQLPQRFFWTTREGSCHEVRITALAHSSVVTVSDTSAPYRLSPREVEVLAKLAEGLGNPDIGRALYLSPRTVATHVEHILSKMGCASRVAAASTAVAEGIVQPPPRGAPAPH
jgi:DNA-binding CsgD family transcriptional regulator